MLYPDGETPYEDDDGIREESRGHYPFHSVLAPFRSIRSRCAERRWEREPTVSRDVGTPFERRDDPGRLPGSVSSSLGPIPLLFEDRLASADDLNLSSPVLEPLRHVLEELRQDREEALPRL